MTNDTVTITLGNGITFTGSRALADQLRKEQADRVRAMLATKGK